MPKLFVTSTHSPLSSESSSELTEIALDGFVDAGNYSTFEKGLDEAFATGGQFLVLDFTRVHYINSTGISALIRFFELYRERKGVLCLANVAKPVGLAMHLLGVTSFIPFVKDLGAARTYVKDYAARTEAGEAPFSVATEIAKDATAPSSGTGERPARRPRRFVPLRPRRIPGLERARVLVITPRKSRFTRVLRLRFKSLNGDYHLFHDTDLALKKYKEISPDLVVVDERCDPNGDFVSRVKIQEKRSLTSIIKLYATRTDVEDTIDFKIWENDYLVEPFDILQLFSLTEAELMRLPKDRKVLSQQVRFEFKSTLENVEKAYKLTDVIVRQAMPVGEDSTAMYAAVKEGIDNAFIHGNSRNPARNVDVNFLVDQRKITAIIEDAGEGFDYEYYLTQVNTDEGFEKVKRRIVEEAVRGGLGILLMSKCTDRIEYSGSGNTLRLEKNL